jgi:hypothetical protein
MNKYENGKIYTIRCNDDNSLIYVGSTIQPLYKRWNDHKKRCRQESHKEYNKLVYMKMRELGMHKFYIELYEEYPCENKQQLNRKEGQIIRLIGTLNKAIAGRTQKEWELENKSKIQETKTVYREKNKEHIKLIRKVYYENNKEKMKEHYEKNKEYFKQKQRENYERKKSQGK